MKDEPVFELRQVTDKKTKYTVDEIYCSEHRCAWRYDGVQRFTPMTNVVVAEPLVEINIYDVKLT